MNATILALSGYILWIMVLLLALAAYRAAYNQANKRKSLKFNADGSDVGDAGQRLTRAHLNAIECFPFIGGVLLLAIASDSSVITNGLAFIVLGARIVQSLVHVASVSNVAIILRFVFFLVQFGICAYWLVRIIEKFM
uniref:MAPEG family protein n=1 Tax=Ningiella ruwaisensis TaxID=2364274 RepID=UPI00109EE6CF|nr:MAPEG family protein [Ningiella ruwaisensis]